MSTYRHIDPLELQIQQLKKQTEQKDRELKLKEEEIKQAQQKLNKANKEITFAQADLKKSYEVSDHYMAELRKARSEMFLFTKKKHLLDLFDELLGFLGFLLALIISPIFATEINRGKEIMMLLGIGFLLFTPFSYEEAIMISTDNQELLSKLSEYSYFHWYLFGSFYLLAIAFSVLDVFRKHYGKNKENP